MGNAIYAPDAWTVLQPLSNAASCCAQLASGRYAIGQFNGTLEVYDTTQTLLGSVAVVVARLNLTAGTGVFLAVGENLAAGWNVYQLDETGALTQAHEPAPGLPAGAGTASLEALAVTPDGTMLVYAAGVAEDDPANRVCRYALTTLTAALPLVTRPGFAATNIRIRANGDVLVVWQSEIDLALCEIVRYDSTGTVQATYPTGQRASIALDPDGLTVWVRLFEDETIERRRVSDGAVLATLPDGLVCPRWFVSNTALSAGRERTPTTAHGRAAPEAPSQACPAVFPTD